MMHIRPYSYYVSNTADPKYSSCQPPGWDEHSFTFSPAVCPSGWTYYAGKEETPDSGKPYSRAFCCARYDSQLQCQRIYGGKQKALYANGYHLSTVALNTALERTRLAFLSSSA